MINITINVDNLTDVLSIFSKIQLLKYTGSSTPTVPINLLEFSTIVNGIDQINNRTGVSDVLLNSTYSQYYFVDPDGAGDNWYISKYSNADDSSASGWSDPIQGEIGSFFYNPMYPSEVNYSDSDKKVINKIRLLIGDPVGLDRSFGDEALSYLHNDNKVFELENKGWPCSISMYGTQYISPVNPSINGYTYLRFRCPINTSITTISGVEQFIDVWYYTFRNSDKQIMDVYDTTYPPTPLTEANCTQDIYMLQASYDILNSETWEALSEDGAIITDSKDTYNPSPGLSMRDKMLSKLKARLDDAIKSVKLLGLSGVRLD